MVASGGKIGTALVVRAARRFATGAIDETCPGCSAVRRLRLVTLQSEEIPGDWPTLVRARRCGGCGATVEDRMVTDHR